jgi:subtilisin family serine protease
VLVANVSWRRLLVAIGLALFASVASAGAASAAPPEKGAVVPDQYIVVFKPTTVDAPAKLAQRLTQEHGGRLKHTYRHALEGYSARLPDQAVKQLRSDPAVKSIEPDRIVQAADIQTTPVDWGQDRIDQRPLLRDNSYNDYNEGRDVHAYVIDSGIKLSHSEFAGRLGTGYDAVTAGGNANDCSGHGTHVAGLLGGETYGVADKVILHPVRVNGRCDGLPSGISRLIEGIDWVKSHKANPAVANISLEVKGGTSVAVDTAVANLITTTTPRPGVTNPGIPVVVAAGNDGIDACTRSPQRVPAAITVGATTRSDARAWFSNYGPCLDLFAPGEDIKSAGIGDPPSDTKIDNGTSMASPHVAGVAALYRSAWRSATPEYVRRGIVFGATENLVTQPGTGSPNDLLYNNVYGMVHPPEQPSFHSGPQPDCPRRVGC